MVEIISHGLFCVPDLGKFLAGPMKSAFDRVGRNRKFLADFFVRIPIPVMKEDDLAIFSLECDQDRFDQIPSGDVVKLSLRVGSRPLRILPNMFFLKWKIQHFSLAELIDTIMGCDSKDPRRKWTRRVIPG